MTQVFAYFIVYALRMVWFVVQFKVRFVFLMIRLVVGQVLNVLYRHSLPNRSSESTSNSLSVCLLVHYNEICEQRSIDEAVG